MIIKHLHRINYTAIIYPASSKYATFAVGATDPDNKRSLNFIYDGAGSNYGKELTIVAPGNYIYSLGIDSSIQYSIIGGGTSASTAYVTGIVSLLLSIRPSLTPAQVKDIICKTAEDQVGDPAEDTPGWDKYYGWGRVNAYKALQYALTGVVQKQEINTGFSKGIISIIGGFNHGKTTFIINSNSPCMFGMFDPKGRSIVNMSLTEGSNRVTLSLLHSGTYLYRIYSKNKEVQNVGKVTVE